MPLVEITECNVLINNKTFFDQPIKTNKKYTKKIVEMTQHRQKYYKFIGIALSRQANTSTPPQISFTGKLEKNDGATMFFIA